MCNAYEQHVRWVEYTQMMQDLELGIPTQQTELDLPQSDMVRINDMAPVMRATANDREVELTAMNFGLPSDQPKRGPVFNYRSDGRRFANSRRCLIPASGFFEYTGTKYPKTRHRFTLNSAPFMAIAGIWREAQGNHAASFAMLTTAPGPDIEPYHDRQVVVLRPQDWDAWLRLSRPEPELLKPLEGGSLRVETLGKRGDAKGGEVG
ncbi:MAG: SOS response-associated peptidase family protein [Mesorhizobium sp.]|nr:SOS response-associated peptidase family protein [Mesorhizobium sp.]MBL8578698.1 SOS response-associated peptidase family protein [Mesorhizobium sp.]